MWGSLRLAPNNQKVIGSSPHQLPPVFLYLASYPAHVKKSVEDLVFAGDEQDHWLCLIKYKMGAHNTVGGIPVSVWSDF